MKTKNPASKARVSKIPPKSFSVLALAISEMAKSTSQQNPQSIIIDPHPLQPVTSQENINTDPDAVQSQPDDDGKEVLICNGKDCSVSIDECSADLDSCDDDGKFYCPSCLYKSAIAQFQQAKNDFYSARETAQLERKYMFAFVGGGGGGGSTSAAQEAVAVDQAQEEDQNAQSVADASPSMTVPNQQCSSVNADVNRENAEDENPNPRVDNDAPASGILNEEQDVGKSAVEQHCSSVGADVNGEVENRNENSRVDIGRRNDGSASGICNREQDACKQKNKSVVGQQSSSFSEESSDGDNSEGVQIGRRRSRRHSEAKSGLEQKRKRIRWTPQEEEMLTEAVKVVADKCKKNISWTSVLEYGRRVFNEGRTPGDLGEKWRTMVRGPRRKRG